MANRVLVGDDSTTSKWRGRARASLHDQPKHLNARVGSARCGGERDRAFNVMRELSQAVEPTNTLVDQLASQLRTALPKTKAMGESLAGLMREMAERNRQLQASFRDSIQSGRKALEAILDGAREELSHLQFQDRMIQELESIEKELKLGPELVAQAVDSSGASNPSEDDVFLVTLGQERSEATSEAPDTGAILPF